MGTITTKSLFNIKFNNRIISLYLELQQQGFNFPMFPYLFQNFMILVQTKSTFPVAPDAMSAADDAMFDYPTPPDTPSETVSDIEFCPTWLAMKLILEIHVEVLSDHTDATKSISYTFGPGRDDYTVGNVFAQVKNMYPMPAETRPGLSLCGCVLDDQSEEM